MNGGGGEIWIGYAPKNPEVRVVNGLGKKTSIGDVVFDGRRGEKVEKVRSHVKGLYPLGGRELILN